MKIIATTVSVPLEAWQIVRPLIFAGLSRIDAEKVASDVLREGEDQIVTLDQLRQRIVACLSSFAEPCVGRALSRLFEFRAAIASRTVTKPCVVVIGGTSGSGKDSLIADLQYLIGIDRNLSMDAIRDEKRRELLEHYASIDNMPDRIASLFYPTYRSFRDPVVDEYRVQVAMLRDVAEKSVRYFENVEFPEFRQPFLTLQGVHAMPGFLEETPNRLEVVISVSETELERRSRYRAELQRGPDTPQNLKRRESDADGIIAIQRFLIEQARRTRSGLIQSNERDAKLREFSCLLTMKLEEILVADGVALERL